VKPLNGLEAAVHYHHYKLCAPSSHCCFYVRYRIFFSSPISLLFKISLFLYHTLSSLVTGKLNEWNVSCCDKQRESVLSVPQQTAVHTEDHTDFKQCEGVGAERERGTMGQLETNCSFIQNPIFTE